MNIDDYFKIGFVLKPHGLKGEVTIALDDGAFIDNENKNWFLLGAQHNLVPYFIERISITGNKGFVKFEDVNNQADAVRISRMAIYLPKSARPKSGRGEFYDDEITGFAVWDSHAGLLGNVTSIMQTGANRLLVVDNNGKEVLIPIDSPLITSINKTKKRINVDLPEGFLDI